MPRLGTSVFYNGNHHWGVIFYHILSLKFAFSLALHNVALGLSEKFNVRCVAIEIRLHLGNFQIYLAFLSVCTNFVGILD